MKPAINLVLLKKTVNVSIMHVTLMQVTKKAVKPATNPYNKKSR